MDGFDPPSLDVFCVWIGKRYHVKIARNECVKEPIDISG